MCRELTKVHETIDRGLAGRRWPRGAARADPGARRVRRWSSAAWPVRRPGPAAAEADDASPRRAREVERLVAAGVARGEAAGSVAAATGMPRRGLYAAERVD